MTAESEALRSFTVFTAARDSVVDGQAGAPGRRHRPRCRAATAGRATRASRRPRCGHWPSSTTFDLVTCYYGAGLTAAEVDALRRGDRAQGGDVEVEMVPGGQRHDHLLVAVE